MDEQPEGRRRQRSSTRSSLVPVTPADPQPRRRRRAVGPPGARPAQDEVRLPDVEREAAPPSDDERLLADRPPHHDRGV